MTAIITISIKMGQLESEDPNRSEDIQKNSLETEGSVSDRPESITRTFGEQNQTFEEISLDSPDLGEDKNSLNCEKIELNNNMKASYDVSKASKKGKDNKPDKQDSSENEEVPKSVPFIKLFRFATQREIVLIVVGIIAAVAGGCSMPVMIILFGQLADAFVSQSRTNSTSNLGCFDQNGDFNIALPTCDFDATNFTTDRETFYEEITKFGTGAAIIGVVNLICSYLFVTCLNHAAESQVFRIRNLFLKAVLRDVHFIS